MAGPTRLRAPTRLHRAARATGRVLLLSLSLFTMVVTGPVDTFVLGHICYDCKTCPRAHEGDAAVVTAVDRKEADNKATVFVFAAVEDARAASRHFIAVDGGLSAEDSSDVLSEDDCL